MISKASKYAIRAVLYLAQKSEINNKIGAKAIAEEIQVPHPFLAKLLRDLATKNIITSTKGPTGGFYLSETNRKENIWNIIENIDGSIKFEQCFLGLSACDDKNPCPVHHLAAKFKTEILNLFKHKSIDDLVKEIKMESTLISLKGLNL
ncbi:Rrf2 family transcriptional regulator [Winogradskyella sp. DF17]|uniref:Rrf2 family transcriptional regulator n=1 Tax=Winogradskyella pelagia TaxID=2819984 RepID=A0ABS3T205_9FLAO|nr:Rrf2 family transcriptional regulator [Winogradskyella sp. DF17]MBO3115916.1 Rrf2 family transcriptional regulator [Winogradskyella sp. DF17]